MGGALEVRGSSVVGITYLPLSPFHLYLTSYVLLPFSLHHKSHYYSFEARFSCCQISLLWILILLSLCFPLFSSFALLFLSEALFSRWNHFHTIFTNHCSREGQFYYL